MSIADSLPELVTLDFARNHPDVDPDRLFTQAI